MMSRCYGSGVYKTDIPRLKFLTKPKINDSYKNYGARGIRVCEMWHDIKVFIKWYNDNINDHETMDRIDNNGDYAPSNVRSADAITQANNKRRRTDVKSGYTGVYPEDKKFKWEFVYNHVTTRQYGYSTALEAMLDRQIHIILSGLPNHVNTIKEPHTVSIEVDPKDVKLWKLCIEYPDGDKIYSSQYQYHNKHKPKYIKIVKSLE